MAEGGNAEKFPDEWDLQFLGNTIISQLSSGTPPDFLIKRYVLFTLYHYNDSILLLKFQISLIQKVFANFSFRIFLSYQSRKALLETELGSTLDFSNSCGCPPSDGSYPGASGPHCSFIRRRELIQLFV